MIPGQKPLYAAFLMLLVNAFVCSQSTIVSAADVSAPGARDSDSLSMTVNSFVEPDHDVLLPADNLPKAASEATH